jgi:Mce-associated membrane protein
MTVISRITTPSEMENPVSLDTATSARPKGKRRNSSARIIAFSILPAIVFCLVLGVSFLKWKTESADQSDIAAGRAVQAASEATIAILAYQPDTADRELHAAADRTTGDFRNDYLKLINDVVIPGSKEKRISATVTIPAAAAISASENRAEVLLFINQTTTFGAGSRPSSSISSVKVTLDNEDGRWLISQFEPI